MEIKDITLTVKHSISDALKLLDATAKKILFVVDADMILKGSLTDGDIRRGILSDISLNDIVEKIMNTEPLFFRQGTEFNTALAKKMKIRKIPIVNVRHQLIGLYDLNATEDDKVKKNTVVLMAGGLGSRLNELTSNTPKPLLNVGGRPILETIIINCAKHGFKSFYISVNYKSEMIKEYFKDGRRWGVNINYIDESIKLGTAGSLSLLNKKLFNEPFFVMNSDLLTDVNLEHMLSFHYQQQVTMTLGVREYDFQVPYGVVQTKNEYVSALKEKPIHRFFVNAGVYILDPTVLNYVPQKMHYDMPTLINKLIDISTKIASFPIHEYWLDIGNPNEFKQANNEYLDVFK